MKPLSKILKSPATVYRWTVASFFALFFVIPFFKLTKTGDDEMFVNLSLITLAAFMGIMLLVSILISTVYRDWFKRNWYINLLVFVIALSILFRLYFWYLAIKDGNFF